MLEENRKIINEIDQEIIKLLEKRYNAASNIAKYKIENNLPVFDKKREDLLFDFYKQFNKSEFNSNIEDVLKEVIFQSRKIQTKIIDNNK